MKKIFLLLAFLCFALMGQAQVIYSVNETNKLLTAYTTGAVNDSIFVFCNPSAVASLSADGTGGTGPYTFNWYQYQTNTHQFSTTSYTTQTGVTTSTISSLTSGGYKVVVTDALNTVVGCDIAWVWNLNIALDAGNAINSCSPFSLSGTANDNGTDNFKYYNPPPDQLIIGPSTNIMVCFTGTHTWVSDLGFYLVGPASCGSPSVVLSPNPGSIGQGSICNSGDNFNNLCFTTMPAANLDVCAATTPLTGVYSTYGPGSTPINWSAFYGCDASAGGWVVQVYDCIGGDVGVLNNASITFSGPGACGANTVTYNSGAINSAINDNACTSTTAASYTVPLAADTTPISITNTLAYNWTSNPPATITNANTLNPSVNPNPTVDTWFYLNLSGTYGCNKVDSVFFHYTAPGTPTITPVGPLCTNSPVMTLTATPPGGTWSGTGITNTVTGVFDPSVAGTGTATVKYVGGGCTGNDSIAIVVNQAATVNAINNIAICDGQVQGPITFTTNPAGSSVSWSNSQTSIGLAASGSGNINPFTAFNGTQAPVTATVTVLANNLGCSGNPSVFTIAVNPLPIPNAGADTSFCAGGSVVLSGSGGGNYAWLPASNLNNSTIANPTASPPSTTVFTLTVTNSFGCSAADMVTVTVNPLPAVSGGPNKIICQGNSVQLSGSGASQYAWAPASSLSNPAIANPLASPTVTTQYTVTGTDAFGCSKQAVVTVVVNNPPAISAGTDQTVCVGNPINLNGTGTANTYTWSPSTGVSNIHAAATTATPTVTTAYVLTGTAANGCVGKDTVNITVNPSPTVFAGNDTAFCAGSSVQLNASASSGVTYSWSPSTGLSSATVSNPVANPTVQTEYVLTVTDGSGCSKKDSLLVTVNALPNVDAGAAQSICPGNSASLNAAGAVNYTWLPASGLSSASVSNPTASPSSTTIYTVTGTDANGCSKSDTVSVSVGATLAVTTNGNQNTCVGASVTLSASSTATSYTWSPATGLSNPNAATTVASPASTTVYTVTAGGISGICPGTATVMITVHNLPSISAPPLVNLCMGTSQNIFATGAVTYTWSPATGLSNPNNAGTAVSTTTNVTYTVSGTDANGCTNMAVVNVNVVPLPVIDTLLISSTNCGSSTGSVQVNADTAGTPPYTYSLNNGAAQPSNQFTGLATGNYLVTLTDANGCKATQNAFVASVNNVHASFNATPGSGSYPLNVSFTNTSTGANTYNWNLGNSSASTTQNPSTVYNTIGVYTVTLIAYNNVPTCSDTAVLTIQVFDQPNVTIPNIVTPNGDGINDEFLLKGYGIKNYEATFYDRWGRKVAQVTGDGNTHWNPQDLHDGTYYYVITVNTIDGKTKEYDGFLTLIR